MAKKKNNKNKYILGLVAVLVVVGFVMIGANRNVKADGGGSVAINATFGEIKEFICALGIAPCPEPEPEALGAIVGPELQSDFWTVGQRTEWNYGIRMRQASTTVCHIIPAFGNATTTLLSLGVSWDVGSTSAMEVTFAKGTANDNTSSTTIFWEETLGASIKGTMFWYPTTTASTLDEAFTFAPNVPLIVTVTDGDQGDDATGLVPVGTCDAQFLDQGLL